MLLVTTRETGLLHILALDSAVVCWCLSVGRVLSTKTGHIAAHLTDLIKLLQPLGMDAADVRKLVLKQPMLLLANPVILASKLERLKVCICSQWPHRAAHFAWPFVVGQPLLAAFSAVLSNK
jgi:hypothetical protein